jgi:hypothetical protein
MDPHFHWGADCEALGYECVELTESTAVCLDESSSCTAGEFKCEDNTAYNCVDEDGHSHWAIEPCGTALECHEETSEAVCEEHAHEGDFDPQTACDAYSGGGGETKQVTTTFDDVFSEDYHADLDVSVTVTLPDNEVSYIHFPVTAGGEYVVFLDVADVLDTILHRDETDQGPLDGGIANGKCPDDLVDHYHAELAYDGDCSGPVPFVLKFKAVSAQDVTFVVMKKADLAFPAQACEQFSTCAGETKQVTTTFDDVFSEDYHADLDVPVTVTLPDNEVSYIHFPVTETAEYVVFLGRDSVFTTIKHRDETDQSPAGGVANGVCESDLPDHWHADLTYDGDGSGPVPFVIEFAAVPAQDVTFIVKRHPEE